MEKTKQQKAKDFIINNGVIIVMFILVIYTGLLPYTKQLNGHFDEHEFTTCHRPWYCRMCNHRRM